MKKIPAILLFTALVLALFFAVRSCSAHKATSEELTSSITKERRAFEEFKTESGLNAGRAEAEILSLQALMATKAAELDALKKELRLKPKTVTRWVTVTTEGKDSIVLKRDTLWYPETPSRPRPFTYYDDWNYFEAFVDGDSINVNYAITDSLTLVETKDGGTTTVTAMSSNPAIRITGVKPVVVQKEEAKKKKFWWLVPVAAAIGFIASKI